MVSWPLVFNGQTSINCLKTLQINACFQTTKSCGYGCITVFPWSSCVLLCKLFPCVWIIDARKKHSGPFGVPVDIHMNSVLCMSNEYQCFKEIHTVFFVESSF